MLLITLFSAALNLAQASPDRIGNGGGVWACQDPGRTIYDVMFMDVFEARREYQLNLPETDKAPLDVVQAQKAWIEKFMKDPHNITKHIEYVEKNITWIDDVINLIPDGANKISPHPSTCKKGDWVAVQLVNFTEDFRILVRRELFDSAFMSNLEKAAVYLHEGIYSYLRTEFGDTDSVRARAIVGYLLSDLNEDAKRTHIEGILNQTVTKPKPPPAGTWFCGIKPETYSALYTFEDTTADKAKAGVLKACIEGENPMNGHLPGFPSIPGFGPPNNCKENNVLCEAVTSTTKNKSCSLSTPFSNKTYTGTGRTQLEAQKETITQCLVGEGAEHSCYDPHNLTCQ